MERSIDDILLTDIANMIRAKTNSDEQYEVVDMPKAISQIGGEGVPYSRSEIDELLAKKANKSDTAGEYGITDVYTKTQSKRIFGLNTTIIFDKDYIPIKTTQDTVLSAGFATGNKEAATVLISRHVISIDGGAFANCPNLTDIYIDKVKDSITISPGSIPDTTTVHYADDVNAVDFLITAIKNINNRKLDNKSGTVTREKLSQDIQDDLDSIDEKLSVIRLDGDVNLDELRSSETTEYHFSADSSLANKTGLSIGTYCIVTFRNQSQYLIAPLENRYFTRTLSESGWSSWKSYSPTIVERIIGPVDSVSQLNPYTDETKIYYFSPSKYVGFGSEAYCMMVCSQGVQYITNLRSGSKYTRVKIGDDWSPLVQVKIHGTDIEDNTITSDNLSPSAKVNYEEGNFSYTATYNNEATMVGTYTLIGNMCFVMATASIKGGWGDIDYALPVTPLVDTTSLTTDATNSYRVSTSKAQSHVYIHRIESNETQTEGTVSFTLVYKYQ